MYKSDYGTIWRMSEKEQEDLKIVKRENGYVYFYKGEEVIIDNNLDKIIKCSA